MMRVSATTLAFVLAVPGVTGAQRPVGITRDTARRAAIPTESVSRARIATLAPIEVRASIIPTASPTIESGVPARVSSVSGSVVGAWRPRTIADVLAQQAGIALYDDLGTPWKLNVSSRGFTVGPTVGLPPGITVFLDGVRQNEPDAQEVNFDLLPTDHIERVELLSGTASLLGPNSLGGAINLVTARGRGPAQGDLTASAGSFGAANVDASARGAVGRGWRYFASGGTNRERGWRDATKDQRHTGFFNITRDTNGRGIRVQGYAARSRAETAGSLPESIFLVDPRRNFTPGDFEDLDVQQVSLSAHAPVSRGEGTLTAFVRRSTAERFNVNQAPDPNVRGLTTNHSMGGTGDWRRTTRLGAGELSLRGGIDVGLSRVRVRIFNEAQGASADSDEGDDADDEEHGLTTDVKSPSIDVAGYLLGDYRRGAFTLSGGVRADYLTIPFRNQIRVDDDTRNTFHRLSPRVGASVDVGGGAIVFASVGESFRAPAILELGCADPEAACPLPFALGDDPPLRPVSSRSYEVGARLVRGAFLLNGSAYRTNVRNEIFFVASEAALLSGYFTNLDRTRREGIEVAAEGEVLGGRADWYANYAVTRATFESPVPIFSIRSDDEFDDSPLAGQNVVGAGSRLPLVPNHQAKAGGSLSLSRLLTLGVDARHIGEQWLRGDEANETSPLAAYTLVNARATLSAGAWQLTSVIGNLFGSTKPIFGTFNENRETDELERFITPMTGRSFTVQVRRRFGAAAQD